MRKLAFSLLLFVAGTFAGAAMSATAQAQGGTQADGADAAIDPASAQLAEIEKTYHAKLVRTLSESADPRDWALASLIGGEDKPGAVSLSARAAAAAPNDALVQWIALTRSDDDASANTHGESAAARLQAIEPGNVNVWMYPLIRASRQHEEVAVDEAMQHMARSTYTDEHWYDAQKALIRVFQQHPLPDAYFKTASSMASDPAMPMLTPESAPYVGSLAITAAMNLPAYQSLVNACKPRTDFQPSAARIGSCEEIGRVMATKGSTLIANRIGFALLRVSRTYTDDDVRIARSQDWIWEKSAALSTAEHLSAAKLIARTDDQNTAGNELEAMRRELVRANISAYPPADWVDTRSPFSPERLQQDRAAAARAE